MIWSPGSTPSGTSSSISVPSRRCTLTVDPGAASTGHATAKRASVDSALVSPSASSMTKACRSAGVSCASSIARCWINDICCSANCSMVFCRLVDLFAAFSTSRISKFRSLISASWTGDEIFVEGLLRPLHPLERTFLPAVLVVAVGLASSFAEAHGDGTQA